jgi:hypothetical protein
MVRSLTSRVLPVPLGSGGQSLRKIKPVRRRSPYSSSCSHYSRAPAFSRFDLRGPVELIFIALGIVVLCLAPSRHHVLRDALRNTALLVVLVPFVTASPPLLPTSWALRGAGNSTSPPPSPT